MTESDLQALSVWTAVVSAGFSIIFGGITVYFVVQAGKQVKIAAAQATLATEQLKQSAQGSLLTVEASLGDARQRWKTALFNKVEQQKYVKLNKTKVAAIRCERALSEHREAYEQFLNRLDRLFATVKEGLISESRVRTDYIKMVITLVEEDPKLRTLATGHENIVHFYLRWRLPETDAPGDEPSKDKAG